MGVSGNIPHSHYTAAKHFSNAFPSGKNPDSPCVQKDDMDKIYPVYKEADIVVLATPLYYWTISGQLKTAFDRLFAVAECDPDYRNPKKESVLIMAAEGCGFEETLYWYEHLEEHLGWKSIGKVLCGGVMAKVTVFPASSAPFLNSAVNAVVFPVFLGLPLRIIIVLLIITLNLVFYPGAD